MNNPVRLLAEKIVDTLCSRGLDGGELPFVESLLREAMDQAKKHAQHCGSCHEDHAEGYAPSDECSPYCYCEGMRAEDERVKEARSAAFKEAAEIVDGAAIDVGLLEKSVVGYEEKKRLERLADKLRLKSEGT